MLIMELTAALDREVLGYNKAAYAPATRRAYATHRRAYLNFCRKVGAKPAPASTATLARYVAYLARRLKFSSVRQYLNVVRLIHLEAGLPNPVGDNFHLNLTLRGIKRELATPPSRKLPITPPLLLHLGAGINVRTKKGASVWAAALIMFFSLLRRSNVLPASIADFCPDRQLRRKDITVMKDKLLIKVRWSKTNQYKERGMIIPLPRTRDALCPVVACFQWFRLSPHADAEGPAFGALTASEFVKVIRTSLLPVVDNPSEYAGHSFRRGGACWAFEAGVPIEAIRQLGDWKSDAYTAYILPSTSSLGKATWAMARALPGGARREGDLGGSGAAA